MLPALGVYASTVRLLEQGRPAGESLRAVTNVGTRPTFEPGQVLTEGHLLGFEGDLYGRELAVEFHERIRAERKFSGPEALRKQIAADSERALELLGSHGN